MSSSVRTIQALVTICSLVTAACTVDDPTQPARSLPPLGGTPARSGSAPGSSSATWTLLGNLPSASIGAATSINDGGIIAGRSGNFGVQFAPLVQLPCTLAACVGDVRGINGSGRMVGFSYAGNGAGRVAYYSDSPGDLVRLPSVDTLSTGAEDVNDAGDIVGNTYDNVAGVQAAAWFAVDGYATMTVLPPLSTGITIAHAIQDGVPGPAAMIVGVSSGRAVVWQQGAVSPLPTLVASGAGTAYDVSPDGEIVGWSQRSGGRLSAVIWRNGTITDIGSICSPDFNSTAYAIATMPNGTELVVGECTTGFTVPVVWYSTANGSFAYEVLPLPPGVSVGRALAVNSSGQIVGQVNDRLPILWTFTPPAPNAPPTVTLAPSFSGDEGTSVPFSVAASDPEGAPLSYSWNFGDGAPPGSGSAPTHDYADNGSYTATVSVSDGVNISVASAIVTIANVAPTATLQVPGVDVTAGQPFAVALSGATDPSTVDLAAGLTYAFDCENDGTFTAPSATPDALCSIAAPGSAIISARILDKDGGVTTYSGTITVVAPVNLPPTLAVGGPYAAQEGTAVTLGASGTDPEGQPLTYSWDFGDGSPAGSGASVTHAFPDNGSYTITVTTSDGTNSTSATTSATITNLAPTGAIVAPIGSSAPQGTVVLALGSLVEPSPVDAASLQYRFNCGSGFGPIVATPSITCALPTTGSRILRIAVRDKDGGQSNYTKTISITNVGPSVTILSPTTVTIPAGSALTFSAAFTDPGTADNPWTARVNWGGGLGIQALGTVTPSVPFGASRIYPTPGTFTALVEVKDRFGAFATRGRITVVVQ